MIVYEAVVAYQNGATSSGFVDVLHICPFHVRCTGRIHYNIADMLCLPLHIEQSHLEAYGSGLLKVYLH